jgi:signal transduction histidine kinase
MGSGARWSTVPCHGSGLEHMTDRLAAVGGTIVIDSRPGAGTTVAGTIPLTGEAAAPVAANDPVPVPPRGAS